MSPDPDFHDTAAAWLDATGDDTSRRLLREILRDSPPAAGEFAALARAEATLQLAGLTLAERRQRARRLLQPTAAVRVRRFMARPAFRWAAAALVLIAGAVWLSSGGESDGSAKKPRIAPTIPREAPPVMARSTVPPDQLPPADRDFVRRMSRFIVPQFTAARVPLAEALETLRKNISAVDRTAVPDFSAAVDFPPDLRVHVVLRSQPVAALLDVIAIQTGVKFQPSGRGYVVSLNPDATPPGGEADFTFPAEALRQLQPPRDLKALLTATDAPTSAAPKLANGEWDAGAVVQAIRMSLGDMPGLVGFDKEGAEINVSGSTRLVEMLRRVLTPPTGSSYPPGTWEWKVTLLAANTPEARAKFSALQNGGSDFDDARWQALLREFSQNKGVDLLASPGLITAAGAQAMHFAGKDSPDPNDPGGWSGVRLGVSNQTAGDREGSVEVKTIIQNRVDGPDGPTGSISHMGTTVSAFPDGNTRLVTVNENEGSYVAVFITGKRDPARDDLPYGIPVAGKPGMVHSPYAPDRGMVDVDGIKRGTRIECPYTGKHFRAP